MKSIVRFTSMGVSVAAIRAAATTENLKQELSIVPGTFMVRSKVACRIQFK